MKKRQSIAALALILAGVMNSSPAEARRTYPKIYPFVPMTTNEIYNDVERVTEDKNFMKNFKKNGTSWFRKS